MAAPLDGPVVIRPPNTAASGRLLAWREADGRATGVLVDWFPPRLRGLPAAVLTHAHEDHRRGVVEALAQGTAVYCTHATRALLLARLPDARAHAHRLIGLDYAEPARLADTGAHLLLSDAGHCEGSAMARLDGRFGCALFTGDFRLGDAPDAGAGEPSLDEPAPEWPCAPGECALCVCDTSFAPLRPAAADDGGSDDGDGGGVAGEEAAAAAAVAAAVAAPAPLGPPPCDALPPRPATAAAIARLVCRFLRGTCASASAWLDCGMLGQESTLAATVAALRRGEGGEEARAEPRVACARPAWDDPSPAAGRLRELWACEALRGCLLDEGGGGGGGGGAEAEAEAGAEAAGDGGARSGEACAAARAEPALPTPPTPPPRARVRLWLRHFEAAPGRPRARPPRARPSDLALVPSALWWWAGREAAGVRPRTAPRGRQGAGARAEGGVQLELDADAVWHALWAQHAPADELRAFVAALAPRALEPLAAPPGAAAAAQCRALGAPPPPQVDEAEACALRAQLEALAAERSAQLNASAAAAAAVAPPPPPPPQPQPAAAPAAAARPPRPPPPASPPPMAAASPARAAEVRAQPTPAVGLSRRPFRRAPPPSDGGAPAKRARSLSLAAAAPAPTAAATAAGCCDADGARPGGGVGVERRPFARVDRRASV